MMASDSPATMNNLFESHPSLSASLEDFESNDTPSPVFRVPSQHSGFKSEDASEADGASNSAGPWSPPGWRKSDASSGWYRHQPYGHVSPHLKFSASGSRSRESSPRYESADEDKEDYTIPANIPLPRGSLSPVKERTPSPAPVESPGNPEQSPERKIKEESIVPEDPSNYIRFSMRADVQHRTESLDLALSSLRNFINSLATIRLSFAVMFSSIVSLLFLMSFVRILFQPPPERPMPDLVKVANLASSFEPLLKYTEHGMQQINNLQQTSIALWDLSETVRQANLTSAPTMSRELDGLSDTLNKLASELTTFFTNVDGDIDGIIIVMDWAKRELAVIPTDAPGAVTTVFTSFHTLFSRFGILENREGNPTVVGTAVTELFGRTPMQQTRFTLQRTFNEFVGILEESIEGELKYSNNLFVLFDTIDNYFDNLQKTTARATDDEARSESDFFSSLWSKVLGPNAARLRKYEKNKLVLHNVRAKTLMNKNMLVEHNHRLKALKNNLESLRRVLLSPLVQGCQGSLTSVEEQIMRLDGTYRHLKQVREDQKKRVLDGLFGPKPWHAYGPFLGAGNDQGIDGRAAIDGPGS